jgi:nucleolar protein 12
VIHDEPVIESETTVEDEANRIAPVDSVVQPHKKGKRKPQLDEESRIADLESRYLKKVHSKASKSQKPEAEAIPEPTAPVGEDEASRAAPVDSVTQPHQKSKKRKRKPRPDEESRVADLESRYPKKVHLKTSKSRKLEAEAIPGSAAQAEDTQISPAVQDPPLSRTDAPEENKIEGNEEAIQENDSKDDDRIDEQDEDENKEDDLTNLIHESLAPSPSASDRTIFLSNIPVKVLTSKPHLRDLKHLLTTHGPLSSIRFRSIAFSAPTPRRASFINKAFHRQRDSANAYAVYEHEDSVQKAVDALNGVVWEGKHLRVDSVGSPSVHDHRRSVFVGNLPFDVADEALWEHFGRCGKIEFVRIVRDKKTNVGKGFGYVQFYVVPRPHLYVPSARLASNLPCFWAFCCSSGGADFCAGP